MGGLMLPGTLQSWSGGTRNALSLGSGPAVTYTSHAFRGISDETFRKRIPPDVQMKMTRTILILGNSISGGAVPKVNDLLTLEGSTGVVLWVSNDPDRATYSVAIRD
jgi:hypothetical protein